jgi:predicted ATPase with chaperone activity
MLFMDELRECRRHVLEVLRQPLEEGITKIPSADIRELAALAARLVPVQTAVPQRQPGS